MGMDNKGQENESLNELPETKEEYRLYMIAKAHSDDPGERYEAASDGFCLDELIEDENWFVRHTARRRIQAEEYVEAGLSSSVLLNPPYLDISDLVYALYKQTWIDCFTTQESRIKNILDWGRRMSDWESEGSLTRHFHSTDYTNVKGKGRMLFYSEFVGGMDFQGVGLYHNRAFVEQLLDYDRELIALYNADIDDDYEQKHTIEELIQRAQKESAMDARESFVVSKNLLEK